MIMALGIKDFADPEFDVNLREFDISHFLSLLDYGVGCKGNFKGIFIFHTLFLSEIVALGIKELTGPEFDTNLREFDISYFLPLLDYSVGC